jgi:hypothetical protein
MADFAQKASEGMKLNDDGSALDPATYLQVVKHKDPQSKQWRKAAREARGTANRATGRQPRCRLLRCDAAACCSLLCCCAAACYAATLPPAADALWRCSRAAVKAYGLKACGPTRGRAPRRVATTTRCAAGCACAPQNAPELYEKMMAGDGDVDALQTYLRYVKHTSEAQAAPPPPNPETPYDGQENVAVQMSMRVLTDEGEEKDIYQITPEETDEEKWHMPSAMRCAACQAVSFQAASAVGARLAGRYKDELVGTVTLEALQDTCSDVQMWTSQYGVMPTAAGFNTFNGTGIERARLPCSRARCCRARSTSELVAPPVPRVRELRPSVVVSWRVAADPTNVEFAADVMLTVKHSDTAGRKLADVCKSLSACTRMHARTHARTHSD